MEEPYTYFPVEKLQHKNKELDVNCEPTNLNHYTGMLCTPNRNTSFVHAHAQFWDFSINTWWKAIGGSSSACCKRSCGKIKKRSH